MIDITETTDLKTLQHLAIWQEGERLISAEPAGEGNMNLVLRVSTSQRSIILKQSKDYVRKFPQIPAPIERIKVEHRFYEILQHHPWLQHYSPKVLGYLPEQHILITQDLGKGSDFSRMYNPDFRFNEDDFDALSHYLNHLHSIQGIDFPANSSMKTLNHEHLFRFPFDPENGMDLDSIQEGLQELSLSYKADADLKSKLEQLGARYLSKGDTLLHGDFYPGSWLSTSNGLKIIDPEFGFLGDKEFDLGILLAHFDLAAADPQWKKRFLDAYAHEFDRDLLKAYQGMEIMRRLIGIAQLPVSLDLKEKEALLKKARNLILS
ncbi:phosphotransferase [Algoriphagus halophytocola]|uniref:Phosphotransferase n=1 Tax=Algoriphagus halophytocola TaxID=2991499 RepID=A0ABY6MH48_9BACT|nr:MULTISPECIES: phosphotransferase [unclassified Algoriphagus]UZD23102.1 phosphotransferase [Algoriphagus sp. TR-M5]WBL44394.1 phosphotransferase [Algoriphagus sp. TR-M9]